MAPAMTTHLPEFTSAFDGPANLPVVHLLGQCSNSLSEYQARRQIERWQTKSVALALFNGWGVSTGYQLEKQLLALEPAMVFPDDRPRLFHRMQSRGEPGIAKELTKPGSLAARWVGKAVSRAPNALEVLADNVWRLLDPSPMRHIDWALVSEALMPRMKERVLQGIKPEVWIVRTPLVPERGDVMEYFVPRGEPLSLWGLLLVLLQLRRWEVSGDLIAYYLQLLEAIERCLQPRKASDLAVLMPECGNYLAACFGRVHIGPTYQANVELQVRRLEAAREAFAVSRGGLASSRATITWG